jgi:hypothetical protein
LCVFEDELLHPFSHGAEAAFLVLQQLLHKYQFSLEETLFFIFINEKLANKRSAMTEMIIFFIFLN